MSEGLVQHCGGPYDLTPAHTITSFESIATSDAELSILAFLAAEPALYRDRRLLHVGIGNGDFTSRLAPDLADYVGITISQPELDLFNDRFATCANTHGLLLNKYDQRSHERMKGQFDLIIDTLLLSVACCQAHFRTMMVFFAGKLTRGGALLTTRTGVQWGWKGNIARAYTPGAQLDPAIGAFRVLGEENLRHLAEELGLSLRSVDVPNDDAPSAPEDRILILTRA